ncbi:MAG: Y-family DNA polymerase [Bacteroidetes bacterium]|nr:Y-family DNA polymerase [Bacteroidota bacterium]
MVALVDCNSFYASCERVFRPDLHNRPIVVLSNNDGCVVAMDRNAKICGIKRGTPYFQVRADLASIHAAIFSSNYTLYQDLSLRVMETLRQHCTRIEVYSIDEAFLFLEKCRLPLPLLGDNILRDVLQSTGIPVSIGFGRTKTLAKIANKWAKTQTAGLFVLEKEYEENILSKINIMDIWGVGPRKAAFLFSRGIRTARELRDLPDHWVKKNLTLVSLRTVWELRGIHSIDPEPTLVPKK